MRHKNQGNQTVDGSQGMMNRSTREDNKITKNWEKIFLVQILLEEVDNKNLYKILTFSLIIIVQPFYVSFIGTKYWEAGSILFLNIQFIEKKVIKKGYIHKVRIIMWYIVYS